MEWLFCCSANGAAGAFYFISVYEAYAISRTWNWASPVLCGIWKAAAGASRAH